MRPHGKLDILRSLDYLLYCHYVYSYFLDASLLVLLFRIFLQLRLLSRLLSPFGIPQSAKTAIGVITAELAVCILLHTMSEPGQAGLIIDFVGNQQVPSHSRLLLQDLAIYAFQVLRILISFSSLSPDSRRSAPTPIAALFVPSYLASTLGTETLTFMFPTSSVVPRIENALNENNSDSVDDDVFYGNELVVDLPLQSLWSVFQQPRRDEEAIDSLPV